MLKPLVGLLPLAVLAFNIAQFIAGFQGIYHSLGLICAILAVLAAGFFGLTLPLVIGAFFGALNVWHWHWFFALLFTLPGLALFVPVAGAVFLSSLTKKKTINLPA